MACKKKRKMADGGLIDDENILPDTVLGIQRYLRNGGKVRGPGGPRDDRVPAMLSNGEYVLPADTVDAVGVNRLEALRDATHKPSRRNLQSDGPRRKMADGGIVRQPRSLLRSAARGGAALGLLTGAGDGLADLGTGYRENFQQNFGGNESMPRAIANDALRVAGGVGNAITFGAAERLGRGLSNLAQGESFLSGVTAPTMRDQYLGNQRDAFATRAANSIVSGNANPVLNTTPAQAGAASGSLRNYGYGDNIYGTASQPGGRIDTFTGTGSPNSAQSAAAYPSVARPAVDVPQVQEPRDTVSGNLYTINQQYDNLARQARAAFSSPRAQGNLSRRLLEIENARQGALNADSTQEATLRGQRLAAQTSNATNAANLTGDLLRADATNSAATIRAQSEMARALSTAQREMNAAQERGYTRYTDAISNMFVDPETGKGNAQEQERFRSFIESSAPEGMDGASLAQMSPARQMETLRELRTMYELNRARNNTSSRSVLNSSVTRRADPPVDVRESAFADVVNNGLPLSDYLYSNLPFTNPNVVVTESGQPVLLSDYATDSAGNWDLDRLDYIRRQTGRTGR